MSAENSCYLIPRTASDPTTIAKHLLESWKDQDYRKQFVRERVQSAVALQIRSLREQRNGMTQTELAQRMGKAQPWISQIENPDYGKWSVATLLDCADAFDSDLEIRFRPFSRSLYELSHQDQHYFEVPSFEEELPELERAASFGWVASTGRWSDLTRAAALLYPSQSTVAPPRATQIFSTGTGGTGRTYQMLMGSFMASTRTVSLYDGPEQEKDARRRGSKGFIKRANAA